MLGYGIPEDSFARGMSLDPDVIAVDAGSTDPGPYYLGEGISFTNPDMVKRDLTLILRAAYERGIPVIIGSAGGGGARPHVQAFLGLVNTVIEENGLTFPTAVILSDVSPETLKRKASSGDVKAFELETALTDAEIDRASNIVAQMGPEPVMKALQQAQLVICGRASDPAVMSAPALMRNMSPALAMHMGKILECGAAAAQPRHGTNGIIGVLTDNHFQVEPSSIDQICSVESVTAHTLYERSNPLRSSWPGGTLDLSNTRFEQFDERTVQVSGSAYAPDDAYYVKVEGAAPVGYRTITLGGTRDPILIREFPSYEKNARDRVARLVSPLREGVDYSLYFRAYGRDGVMGSTEPTLHSSSHELGILIEAIGRTEAISRQVLAIARSAALHSTYPGRKAIAGNLAFPFSPSDLSAGVAYEFNIYHLVRLDDPLEFFPIFVDDSIKALMHAVA
jgi:hypothetical protein